MAEEDPNTEQPQEEQMATEDENTPLSAEEQALLDRLLGRAAAAEKAREEQSRQERLANMAKADELVNMLNLPALHAKMDEIVNDPKLDFETKTRVQNFRTSLTYNIGGIRDTLTQLRAPAA